MLEDKGNLPESEPGSNKRSPRTIIQIRPKLMEQLKRLTRWRIDPSFIKFPNDPCESHGGHATVFRAFLVSSLPSSGCDDAAGRCAGLGSPLPFLSHGALKSRDCKDSEDEYQEREQDKDKQKYERGDGREQQHNSGGTYGNKVIAVKKPRMADDMDLERVLGLALREAEFLVELCHPNIVKLEGFVEDVSRDMIWLVFPWEYNGDLRSFLTSQDWEIPERLSLIDDVTKGVEYLHKRRPPICHGDLKSPNILVNQECHAVITDFGSARRLANEDIENQIKRQATNGLQQALPLEATFCATSNTITLTGNKYTIRWAAPELLMEDQPIPSVWSDMWALGWVSYEVMTNAVPFQNVPTDLVVVEHVIKGELPSITDDARISLIRELCFLMAKCWSIDPCKRPTVEDYRNAIKWMPMVVPNPTRVTDAVVSRVRSPELLMKLGTMHEHLCDYLNASKLFTEALGVCGDIRDHKGKASALLSLAEIHRLQNEYNQAMHFYSEALQIYSDIEDRKGKAEALWGLASVHRFQGMVDQSMGFYSQALQIYTEIGDNEGVTFTLWGLAQVNRDQSDYCKAIELYSEALRICIDIGNRLGRADALAGLADVHRLRNEYNQAFTLYSEALKIHTEMGNRKRRADDLWGLAGVHLLRDECSEAVILYSEALQLCTDISDKQGRAEALRGLGDAHSRQGKYDEAVTYQSGALQIANAIGDRQGKAEALRGLADMHQFRNEYIEAISLYSEAARIATDIGNKRGRAEALLGLAEAHRRQDHHSEAMCFYARAAETFEQIGDNEAAGDALQSVADIQVKLETAS